MAMVRAMVVTMVMMSLDVGCESDEYGCGNGDEPMTMVVVSAMARLKARMSPMVRVVAIVMAMVQANMLKMMGSTLANILA